MANNEEEEACVELEDRMVFIDSIRLELTYNKEKNYALYSGRSDDEGFPCVVKHYASSFFESESVQLEMDIFENGEISNHIPSLAMEECDFREDSVFVCLEGMEGMRSLKFMLSTYLTLNQEESLKVVRAVEGTVVALAKEGIELLSVSTSMVFMSQNAEIVLIYDFLDSRKMAPVDAMSPSSAACLVQFMEIVVPWITRQLPPALTLDVDEELITIYDYYRRAAGNLVEPSPLPLPGDEFCLANSRSWDFSQYGPPEV